MKKQNIMMISMGGILLSFCIGAYVGAATNHTEPGSVGDPIITKSYLEERLSEIKGNSNTSNTDNFEKEIITLREQLEEIKRTNYELKKQLDSAKKEMIQSNFKKVTVKAGKTLVMKYGTEMIFYSGQGKFKTVNNKYILDLTERNHVINGGNVLLYHKYLIRSGCNLEVIKDAVVYIQGTYSVK